MTKEIFSLACGKERKESETEEDKEDATINESSLKHDLGTDQYRN